MSTVVRCPACASQVEFVDLELGVAATCPKCGAPLAPAESTMPAGTPCDGMPADDRTATRRLPHPGFWGALAWSFGIVVVLQLLPGFLAGISAAVLHRSGNPAELFESPDFAQIMLPFIAFGQATAIGIVCLVIPRVMGPTWRRQIGLRRPTAYHVLLAILGLPGIIVPATAVQGLAKLVLPELFDVEGSFRMIAQWPWFFGVMLIGFAPGMGEELWFRAFLGRGLVGRYGLVAGILLTSLFFGLVHVDPRHAAVAFTIGIALHLAYLASGSLWIPMLMHTLNNTVSILALRSREPTFLDATAADIPWTVYTAGFALLGAVGWGFYRTRVPTTERPGVEAGDPLPAPSAGLESEAAVEPALSTARRPDLAGWVVPLAAACLFAGFTIRATVEYNRRAANAQLRGFSPPVDGDLRYDFDAVVGAGGQRHLGTRDEELVAQSVGQ